VSGCDQSQRGQTRHSHVKRHIKKNRHLHYLSILIDKQNDEYQNLHSYYQLKCSSNLVQVILNKFSNLNELLWQFDQNLYKNSKDKLIIHDWTNNIGLRKKFFCILM